MKREIRRIAAARLLMMMGLLMAFALPSLAAAAPPVYPEVISLPDGFRPEGIASGRGTSFYAGSLANGAVFGGDLRTGEGDIVVPGQTGRVAAGLKLDPRTNYLFVAGASTGQGYVYDATTGAEVAVIQLTAPSGNFINDVVVTRDAAYFTNSSAPVFFRLPLGPGGSVPEPVTAQPIALTGDWTQVAGFNANGIAATPDGSTLIIVNSSAGKLYRVDPLSGVADEIELGGASMTAGDGILLDGKTLYVVRNRLNQIAVIALAPDLSFGEVVGTITDPDFNVPTTIAEFGDSLYAVNAKFGAPDPGATPYEAVKVAK